MSNSRYISNNLRSISPDQARMFLTKTIDNRPIRHYKVMQFAADIRAGRWRVNGETLSFDVDGYLINGHHRLRACIEADVAFETYVITGLDRDEVIESIDTGSPRSAGDFLHFKGYKNATMLAATASAASYILARQGTSSDAYQLRSVEPLTSRSVLLAYLLDNPTILETVEHFSGSIIAMVNGICPGAIVTGTVAAIAMSGQREDAFEFGEQVCTGEGLESGSPILKLRQKLMSVALKPGLILGRAAHMNLLMRTWAFFITDTEMTRLSNKSRAAQIPQIATAVTDPSRLYYPVAVNKEKVVRSRKSGTLTAKAAAKKRFSKR